MKLKKRWVRIAGVLAVPALLVGTATAAQAYSPTGGTIFKLSDTEQCLKGRGNCAIYPKSAQLPDGRLVATFEKATVNPTSGSAIGETLPVYTSDDYGDSWQKLSDVKAPAFLSSDPRYAKYTSNWTNPYLYVLPQNVGNLRAGTLLLASVVSGDDHYYIEHKAADPAWTPSSDGDRADMAIALFSSTDDGVTWNVVNVVATGGWEGGSAGAIGKNVATANTHKQVDPLWEPFLMVYDGKLVAYYSDENDYLGYDPKTGALKPDPNNDTATDSTGQVLVHKTWDGKSASWSDPVLDVAGTTVSMGGTKTEIGGGRPGMTTVVPTTDGKWMMTYEYWAGGANVRYKVADSPLRFFADGTDGTGVDQLPTAPGSAPLAQGGSPVTIALPDGRLAYNAAGSGDIWVNESGRSTGQWTQFQAPVGSGYSRNLQYVQGTGRLAILRNEGTSTITYSQVDLGRSAGAYYRLVNKLTGQVIGTGGNITSANYGNGDRPDVVLETPAKAKGAKSAGADTQYWHLVAKNGAVTLLNEAGGREAAIWTGSAVAGQELGQWVDNTSTGLWKLIKGDDGYVKFQSVANPSLYMTGAAPGAHLTLQAAATDGSQEWKLVQEAPTAADLTADTHATGLIALDPVASAGEATIRLDASAADPAGTPLHAGATGTVYAFAYNGKVLDLGKVSFGADQTGTVRLSEGVRPGKSISIAVVFDDSPMMWDSARFEQAR